MRAVLERVVHYPAEFPQDVDTKLALHRYFEEHRAQQARSSANANTGAYVQQLSGESQFALACRAFLLTCSEGIPADGVAYILGIAESDVAKLMSHALAKASLREPENILIIEDDALIAEHIARIVEGLGHRVAGIAETRDQALNIAKATRPGLILADILLADDSSGIEAVLDIQAEQKAAAIFVTGLPERLLSGKRPEPTFLITKPFEEETLRTTVTLVVLLGRTTNV